MSTKRKGRIYTFYSYKGGVGRSMALANVAALMVKAGQKVLIVDWDPEAPGLEAFFMKPPAILEEKGIIKAGAKKVRLKGSREKTKGIVDLLSAKANGASLDWRDCLLEATVFDRPMWIITA